MRAHLGEDSVIRAHKSISLSTGRPNSIFILSKLLFGGHCLLWNCFTKEWGSRGNTGKTSFHQHIRSWYFIQGWDKENVIVINTCSCNALYLQQHLIIVLVQWDMASLICDRAHCNWHVIFQSNSLMYTRAAASLAKSCYISDKQFSLGSDSSKLELEGNDMTGKNTKKFPWTYSPEFPIFWSWETHQQ